MDTYIVPLGHIILIPSQPVFVFDLSPKCCVHVLSGEVTNTISLIFGLTRSVLEPTIYRFRGEHANHYITDAIPACCGFYLTTIKNYNISLFNALYYNKKDCHFIDYSTSHQNKPTLMVMQSNSTSQYNTSMLNLCTLYITFQQRTQQNKTKRTWYSYNKLHCISFSCLFQSTMSPYIYH